MNSGKDKDLRQRQYFQTYRSETKTLALTVDRQWGLSTGFVNARVRIRKEDRRLPMIFYCAFEPDGGSPDMAFIAGEQQPSITVRECVLLNRSYIPIVNRLGSAVLGGGNSFPNRRGSLGVGIDINADCDAADISLHLVQALGEKKGVDNEGSPIYHGGRWICGYSLTCNDRLSQEEWNDAVTKCNMMVDMFTDTNWDGVPVLGSISSSPQPARGLYGTDTEGTGGTNIPNTITVNGPGGLG